MSNTISIMGQELSKKINTLINKCVKAHTGLKITFVHFMLVVVGQQEMM